MKQKLIDYAASLTTPPMDLSYLTGGNYLSTAAQVGVTIAQGSAQDTAIRDAAIALINDLKDGTTETLEDAQEQITALANMLPDGI